MLGEKNAASLGVSAGGRDMRMQTVLKAVKEAVPDTHGLKEGETNRGSQ